MLFKLIVFCFVAALVYRAFVRPFLLASQRPSQPFGGQNPGLFEMLRQFQAQQEQARQQSNPRAQGGYDNPRSQARPNPRPDDSEYIDYEEVK